MQEQPLNVPMILRHAERLHRGKTVATKTSEGVSVKTFAETLERTRRLIGALRATGVGSGDRVATFCWNHQQHLETYLAVPCMGAILHMLNIRLFGEDLAYIVEHAEDRTVIVDKSLWPAWEKVAARVSCVRKTIVVDDVPGPTPPGTMDYESLVAGAAPAEELPDIPEDQAAAMCYTSGTTGHPKGVVYSHRSSVLHSLMVCMADTMGLSERDVAMAIVPMFHANAWGIPYACFLAGADMVMPGRFLAPDALSELLALRGVTFAGGVPTIWQGMLEPMKRVKDRMRLDRVVCGGSAIPPSLQKAFYEEFGIRIIHAWGMTETSPCAAVCRPLAAHSGLSEERLASVLSSQGRVVPGVEIRLVGDDGQEVAWDGQSVGEIQVRGNWIAATYYEDESSGEKFQDGWLRTGDVASIDTDGYIRIVDRTKDLIKSGGEWISSVALEGLLMGHPDVAEAAVIAVSHPRWSERPLACVVPRSGARDRLSREVLVEFLAPHVARWWLPDEVVFLEELPKTSVGKFDKKVLRERFRDHVLPDPRPDQATGERPPS